MSNEIQLTESESIVRVEIDSQIATAKKYPRDIVAIINTVHQLATLDVETAKACFYALPRKEKQTDGSYKTKIIEGESIRFAELVMSNWGNLRISDPVIKINEIDKSVTVTIMAGDLEKNIALPGVAVRKFYNFEGSKELAIANAISVATRNAILRIIPKGLFKKTTDAIKEVIKNDQSKPIAERIKAAIKFFASKGIKENDLLELIEVKSISEITKEHLVIFEGFATAINEGESIESILSKKKSGINSDEPIEARRNDSETGKLPLK